MKKIYLDSLNIKPSHLKSVLRLIYHLIVINRSKEVTNFKFAFDKILERQYCEISDKKILAEVSQQIEYTIEKVSSSKAEQFSLSFKVVTYGDKSKQGIKAIFTKTKINVMEEYVLPINISETNKADLGLLNRKLQEQMKTILFNIQNDETGMNIAQNLKFEMVFSK